MQDLLKFDWKELAAVAIIFLIAFGIGSFPPKATLPDYSPAIAIQAAALGQPAAFHIQIASFFEGFYASFLGMPATSPDTIVSFLLFWPAKLFALTAIFLYLSMRAFGFRKTVAAFSAILFMLSQAALLQFLPGVFSSASVAAMLFSLFFLFMALYSKKGHAAWLAPSIVFGALCAYSDFGFGAAVVLSSALFAAAAYAKKGGSAPYFAAAAIVFAIVLAAAPSQPSFALGQAQELFTGAPFLAAAASLAVVLFAFNAASLEACILALGAIAASIFSPLAGAVLLTYPASEGISRASDEKLPAVAKLSCAFFLFFFAMFGLAAYQHADPFKAIALSGLLSSLAPLAMHFCEYNNRRFFAIAAILLVGLSLFLAVFCPYSQYLEAYPKYADIDEASALSYLSGKGAGSVCLLGNGAMASFYLQGAAVCNQAQFAEYLLKGAPVPSEGHMLLSLSYIDYPEEYGLAGSGEAGFESFSYVSSISGSNADFALFSSAAGGLLIREIGGAGAFALKDGQIIDAYGRPYGSIPLSRMLLLSPNEPFASKTNRLIVLEEGASLPNFISVYSAQGQGQSSARQFGKVTVREVE